MDSTSSSQLGPFVPVFVRLELYMNEVRMKSLPLLLHFLTPLTVTWDGTPTASSFSRF